MRIIRNMEEVSIRTFRIEGNDIGDQLGFDRRAMTGYKCEKQLARHFEKNRAYIVSYLSENHSVPEIIKVKKFEFPEDRKVRLRLKLPTVYDEFHIVDLLKSQLIEFTSKRCIKLCRIYHEEGLDKVLDRIMQISPILHV